MTAGGQGLSGVPLVPGVSNVSSTQATSHRLVGLSKGIAKSDLGVSDDEAAAGKDLISLIEATDALARESEAAVNFSNTAGSDDKRGARPQGLRAKGLLLDQFSVVGQQGRP